MVEPSKADLRRKMRWAYENREKCWEMGRKGSEWVKYAYPIRKQVLSWLLLSER